jgi:hypothetical protein
MSVSSVGDVFGSDPATTGPVVGGRSVRRVAVCTADAGIAGTRLAGIGIAGIGAAVAGDETPSFAAMNAAVGNQAMNRSTVMLGKHYGN